LSAAVGREAAREGLGALERSRTPAVSAVVVRMTEQSQLCIESDDLDVLKLGDRAVYAQPVSSATLFRIQGMFEILTYDPLPAECLLTPFAHDGVLERRQWIRVPTVLPVRLELAGNAHAGKMRIETTSVDLSGGGLKICDGPSAKDGLHVEVVIELPTGPIEVAAEVLETMPDGITRLRFVQMKESAYRRVVRHIFDVQRASRRAREVGDN
jgi:PilZ domain-containing protein